MGWTREESVGVSPQRHKLLQEAQEPSSKSENNFLKCALWSPDGSVILATHDDASVRLYQVQDPHVAAEEGAVQQLTPYCTTFEGGPVCDVCFFPGFTWEQPATCCFITSSQDHPIHLRDAVTGSLRNTYRPFNNVDEVCHASSLCFSLDGSRIVAGFPLYLRVFDLQRPGRQVEDWLLSTRKGKGQKGIIGAVTASPVSPGLYAAGSYNRNICLYHQGSRGKAVGWLADLEQDYVMGGVTQLTWVNEWLLLSGHRKDHWLRAWDLRMVSSERRQETRETHPKALLHRFPRAVRTHQRFMFSVEADELATGEDSGNLVFYSLTSLQEVGRIQGAHGRPCVAAGLRPGDASTVLSASGSRCFPNYNVQSPLSSPREAQGDSKRAKVERSTDGWGGAKGVVDLASAAAEPLDNALRVWRWRLP